MYAITNTPAIASARRPTLLQKYRIPEFEHPSVDADSNGHKFIDDGSGSLAEVEPFGWKIGIKAGGKKFQLEQEKQKHLRQLQHLRHQRQQQKHLQRGIEKLMHNSHYRQMYERFKGSQLKYKNELERILTEDCQFGEDFSIPKERVWKTSAQIEKERLEAIARK